MNAAPTTVERIGIAVAGLGDGMLTESALTRHVAPLFSRALSRRPDEIYLANHSLGRPLDATEEDVREALDAWYGRGAGAWDAWSAQMHAFRARIARLAGAARDDCIVPKTSAGAGLRAVLNSFEGRPRVLTTRGEFDSLDVILREYAHRGRIELAWVEPREGERFETDDILRAIERGVDLVVVSQVMFRTGQWLSGLDEVARRAHATGATLLVDLYHSLGVVPLDLQALGADFAVAGSYKYLRGGPGACFLYVAPALLDGATRTLDIGWFAKEAPFNYERPDPPRLAAGGDAWLESTPPVLTWYQARAGQVFALAVGVARLRAYSLVQQGSIVAQLRERGVAAQGGTPDRGAFVVVVRDDAAELADALRQRGIHTDARGSFLRLCPDLLTTADEIQRTVSTLAALCGR